MSKISKKILTATTLSVSAIIIIFFSFIEYKHYEKSLSLLENNQRLITEGQAILLSQYIYEKDEESTYLTLTGIIANPIIIGVDVFDIAERIVFSIGKTDEQSGTHIYEHPITYFEKGEVIKLGKIRTYASDALIINSIKNRISSFALMVLLVIFAIVVTVAITVRNVVEKPISMLAHAIASNTEACPEPLVWQREDEMGLLISQFNKLNYRLYQVLDGLRSEIRDNEIMEGERLKSLANATFEGIVIHRDGVILDVNEATCTLVEIPRNQIIGSDLEACIGIGSCGCGNALQEAGKNFQRKTIRLNSGPTRTVEISSREINYGREVACVVAIRDVTDQVKSQERIEFLAHYDHLTRLSNRFKFHEDLSANRAGGIFGAVLCMDLDGFKSVNDFNGHAVGDELLKQVGIRLRSVVRKTDAVARLGGDEFAVAMFGANRKADSRQLARKVICEISRAYNIDNVELTIGVSVGIALRYSADQTAEVLLKQADMALYEAKRLGKGQYQLYEPHLETSRRRGIEVESKLRTALYEELIEVHFQPQANTDTGEIIRFEALARWNDAVLGMVAPDEFIPIAEQSGLIRQLGEQVLRKACETAVLWPPQYGVAVNLSAAEFVKSDLVMSVETILRETGLDPCRLELEITESALMQNENLALDSIRQLKKLGTTIAIDDFGTGYSSLSFLQRYPFDRIKIDKSFIRSMEENPEAALIVRSIINLSHSLKIGVIAEGVETEDDLRRLKMERCSEIQGYLIGLPMPADELHRYFLNDLCAEGSDAQQPPPFQHEWNSGISQQGSAATA